ncbi:P-loop containing nucleoside triphosphate hydrolase protein [Saccharata proteae CBS 121410]|uniref:RNA helicase n=1 Tax=Saccharata proteae CBS 121410 TaxID=1314787 RepID=A0A9P4HPR8_9PEZI|nr:P-loop containing nucleoside triphosphate hydrolase protein [Saccharata proteae CBS 121410]
MARSPSPTGSAYSRRSRREDDRYNRSRRDDRGYRRRSRSRSPDRRHRDHEYSYRRRDRSVGREDSYRPGRRNRSPERRRPDRSPERDRRERDRDTRNRRGDPQVRDGARDRREASADSRYKPTKGPVNDVGRETTPAKGIEVSTPMVQRYKQTRPTMLNEQGPKSSSPGQPAVDAKQAERQKKLEAWKAKQAAKEKEAAAAAAASTPRDILAAMDKKEAASPMVASPTVASPATDDTTPTPYAGKFDPKAIAKKAKGSSNSPSTLGIDVPVPVSTKTSAAPSVNRNILANKQGSTNLSPSDASKPIRLSKAGGNVSGFGFGNRSAEIEKGTKRGLDFDDEESTRKKLERLPTPPIEESGDAALANDDHEDVDDDADMAEGGTEEEIAAAARAAAEKREERLQNQMQDMVEHKANSTGEAEMKDADTIEKSDATVQDARDDQEEEEIDPLDAFMSGLVDSAPEPRKPVTSLSKNGPQQEPKALLEDDDMLGHFDDENDEARADDDPNNILQNVKNRKKRNDLQPVNHSKMKYEPVRFQFYNEPTEMAEMTEEEVTELRFQLEDIKVRGTDVPKPVMHWAQCGLGIRTLDVLRGLGFENPTAIQSQAIPTIMSGRDMIGVAKTGSGKTIAFVLPMFRHILDQPPLKKQDGPIGLIMAPTRELATQIYKETKPFAKALSMRVVVCGGGAPIKDQIAELKKGAEIIVCTPGRLTELLGANGGRVTNLHRCTYVVLDEADRMFDMGFEPQITRIMRNIRPERQTLLFSATFPKAMEALARKTLTNPVEVVVGGKTKVAPEVTQIVEVIPENDKFKRLMELLGILYAPAIDAGFRTLIFVERQESADLLFKDLNRYGYEVMSIHGGRDQIDRDTAIADFKSGALPVLTATSVAARGLDVKQLKLVVNYDVPNHLEDYVHRAGRTGRAGQTGTCVTFITPEQDRYAHNIIKALKESDQPIPADLQALETQFKKKIKEGKEKGNLSGFTGGHGLEKFTEAHAKERNRERKQFKSQTGDDGDDDEDEKDEKKDDRFVVRSAADAIGDSIASVATTTTRMQGIPEGIDLENIIVQRSEQPDQAAKSNNPLDSVNKAAADINSRLSRLNQTRPGQPVDNKGPDAGAFHATLEINDFPQKARWAVTNRTNVAKILEATGTSITTKGSYYPPGKGPVEGDGQQRKLYILVEGDTEVVVTNAMKELIRLLKEGTVAAADSESRAPVGGRYTV